MRVALPLFGSRVSPRCLIAREMLVVDIADGSVIERTTAALDIRDEEALIERLIGLGVDLLVCGGISRELVADLEANGVGVANNVAGEVEEILPAIESGELLPGHGLEAGSRPSVLDQGGRAAEATPSVDCVECGACRERGECPLAHLVSGEAPYRPSEERIYEVGRDISAETDPKLCRIAELVHFAKGMGYRRIGLAFCWELFREVETLTAVLSRFFEVVPVCCRIGGGADASNGGRGAACNPLYQAGVLNRARTELNVLAGLCMGSDLLFTERSKAPVTTLFVKDRSLAHNPVGAIYTRYHLEELERAPSARSRRI